MSSLSRMTIFTCGGKLLFTKKKIALWEWLFVAEKNRFSSACVKMSVFFFFFKLDFSAILQTPSQLCMSSAPGPRSGQSKKSQWKRVLLSFTRTWVERLSLPRLPLKPCWSCSRPQVCTYVCVVPGYFTCYLPFFR